MVQRESTAFDARSDVRATAPTLIEGLPGLGLVASITVDQLTRNLELEYHGEIRCAELPPVVSYDDGQVRDLVRVYAGTEPSILTLQSDLPIPSSAYEAVSRCVLNDLVDEFERAIFLAGAPAASEEELGQVTGVATTGDVADDLADAGIELAEGSGLVGGVTGALVNECYRNEVPAAVLLVKSTPHVPDPGGAVSVIDEALEPLLGFDIDTTELQERAESIKNRLERIAQQYQQAQEAGAPQGSTAPGMYQ